MKKFISLFVALILVVSTVLCVHAKISSAKMETLKIDDAKISMFSSQTIDALRKKIEAGGNIYYGKGTSTPSYLSESAKTSRASSDIVYLPSGAAVIDFEMQYGNTYYSQYTFQATSTCNMLIDRTCSSNYPPCNIKLRVIDKTANVTICEGDLPVNYESTVLSVPLVAGHEYYLEVSPNTTGESFVSFVVYGR